MGGGGESRWKKIGSFASRSPSASSAEKKKENKKECTKKVSNSNYLSGLTLQMTLCTFLV